MGTGMVSYLGLGVVAGGAFGASSLARDYFLGASLVSKMLLFLSLRFS